LESGRVDAPDVSDYAIYGSARSFEFICLQRGNGAVATGNCWQLFRLSNALDEQSNVKGTCGRSNACVVFHDVDADVTRFQDADAGSVSTEFVNRTVREQRLQLLGGGWNGDIVESWPRVSERKFKQAWSMKNVN
jgi:hypothetical protein